MFGDKNREIETKIRTIEKQANALAEKDDALAENKVTIEKQANELDELRKKQIETARKLKIRGLPSDEISELTGLSIEEIEKL
jgi:DNA-directed RNA polymerase specialized sigma24 family protein